MNEHVRHPRIAPTLPASCPPRGLCREQAAAYVKVTPDVFDVFYRDGRIPRAALVDGAKIWDRTTLRVCPRSTHSAPVVAGVYVVGFSTYVKIGVSRNVHNRIRQLEESLPEKLTLITILSGDRRLEGALHRQFAAHRCRGEWFRRGGELDTWITSGCPLP